MVEWRTTSKARRPAGCNTGRPAARSRAGRRRCRGEKSDHRRVELPAPDPPEVVPGGPAGRAARVRPGLPPHSRADDREQRGEGRARSMIPSDLQGVRSRKSRGSARSGGLPARKRRWRPTCTWPVAPQGRAARGRPPPGLLGTGTSRSTDGAACAARSPGPKRRAESLPPMLRPTGPGSASSLPETGRRARLAIDGARPMPAGASAARRGSPPGLAPVSGPAPSSR
jgi:hypothetical protein